MISPVDAMSDKETERGTELWDDSEYEASGSSTVTSAQLSGAPQKKPRYSCTFHPESSKFTWAIVSRKGPTYARCTVCNRDVSVAYGGTKDLRKHEQTRVHQEMQKSQSGVSSLTSYFSPARGPTREPSVIEAEVKFGYFLGEHHIPLSVADHCAKLFASMFPDSAIAKSFKCGRKKATAIVEVVAQEVKQAIVSRLEESRFFSIQIDETTDITVNQQCGVMLRFFDNKEGKVRCPFYSLVTLESATANGIFQCLDKLFSDGGPLKYSKLVGLGSDGASVMLGSRNSVLTRLQTEQPALVSFHCNCHIAALIANHACKELPDYLDDLTVQIWYFFQKSPKRLRLYQEFQHFVDVKPHKLLKAGQTRWLSLEICVNRLLEQHDALLSYFRSSSENLASVRRITESLEKPLSRLFLMFLSDSLPVINIFNKMMQQQSPALHSLKQEVHSFLKKLILRFMNPEAIHMPLQEIDINDTSAYKPLEQVFIGEKAERYLSDSDMSRSEVNSFRGTCQKFWITSTAYAMKKLPVSNNLLDNISWIIPFTNDYGKADQVLSVAKLLPQVIQVSDMAALNEEYMDYCTSELPFPQQVMPIDEYWHNVSAITDIAGDIKYRLLSMLAKAILIIPHGNADIERMFSHVGLNKTKLRNRLSNETLSALLCLQFNVSEPCFDFKPTKVMVEKCRNAISSLSNVTD